MISVVALLFFLTVTSGRILYHRQYAGDVGPPSYATPLGFDGLESPLRVVKVTRTVAVPVPVTIPAQTVAKSLAVPIFLTHTPFVVPHPIPLTLPLSHDLSNHYEPPERYHQPRHTIIGPLKDTPKKVDQAYSIQQHEQIHFGKKH